MTVGPLSSYRHANCLLLPQSDNVKYAIISDITLSDEEITDGSSNNNNYYYCSDFRRKRRFLSIEIFCILNST